MSGIQAQVVSHGLLCNSSACQVWKYAMALAGWLVGWAYVCILTLHLGPHGVGLMA